MIRLLLLMAFIGFFAAPARADCALPSEGLVSHWKFDETSGATVAVDAMGINNGTLTQMDPAGDWVPGKIGNAIEFSGGNDRVEVAANDSLRYLGAITIAAWINPAALDTGSDGDLILDRGTNYYMSIWNHGGAPNLNFGFNNGSYRDETTTTGPFSAGTGQWYHVAATYNDSTDTIKLYVNGAEQTDDGLASSYSLPTGVAVLKLGNDSGNNLPYVGQMDDVRVYNRALSAAEVAALYSQRSTAAAPAGYMTYDTRHSRMMYCNGTNWVHAGTGGYNPNAVNFDGTNDYLTRGAGLTGAADSKKFTMSFWFRTSSTASQYLFDTNPTDRFSLNINPSGQLALRGSNSAATIILNGNRSNALNNGQWHHVVYSTDMAVTDRIVIDGVVSAGLQGTGTFINDVIDFTVTDFKIGEELAGFNEFNGDLADLWIDFGTYIDLSLAANRAKFRSPAGLPMYLGADGSLATGAMPEIFLSGATSTWHTNDGSGGGFTLNGALDTAATQPGSSLVAESGDIYCWGSDAQSQIGISAGVDTNNQPTSPVAGGHAWTQVITGDEHGCGITAAGDAYCWGNGNSGEMGDGSSTDNTTPNIVSGGYKWSKLSGGIDSTCGITTAGDAYCWGADTSGQLGNGASGASNTPSAVAGGYKWIDIEIGDEHACGIRDNGAAWCWGRDTEGQLGCNSCGAQTSPTLVLGSPTGTKWTKIAAAWQYSCGLRDDGTAWCWGTDGNGNLGNGGGSSTAVPGAVAGGHTFTAISAGDDTACALKANGEGYCWGEDGDGQMGNGAGGNQASPGLVAGGHAWKKIEAADFYACGLTTGSDAYCWGVDTANQLGNGAATTDQHLPNLVLGGFKWKDVAPVHTWLGEHTCGLISYGCTSPDGLKGQMMYNPDFNVMQYCNGKEWAAMGPVGGTPPASGLVGHWKLDESGNTNTAVDSSASGNNGTLTAFPADESANWISAKAGNGLTFDGTDDFVSIGDQSELDLTGDVTVAAWVKTTDDHGVIFNKFKFTDNKGYMLSLENASGVDLAFTVGSGALLREARIDFDAYNDGTWHHVAGVKNGTGPMRLFVDGAETTYEVQDSGVAIASPAGWSAKIGQRSDTNEGAGQLAGAIDDISIYNRVLTAQEVNQLYYFGLSGGLGDVSGNCANPSLPEGAMFYNIDHGFMQYCNGEGWIGIGK